MKFIAFCAGTILSALVGVVVGMQSEPRIIYSKWPDPRSVGYQMPNAEALRSSAGFKLVVGTFASEEPEKSFARTAQIDTATFQAAVERRFRAAAVPVRTSSTTVMLVSAAVTCTPVEPSVCLVDVSLRFQQPLKTTTGQEVPAISWETVDSFLVPSPGLSQWVPQRVNVAVDRFIADWKSVH